MLKAIVIFFWSVAFKDWMKDERRGADYAYNALMEQLHPVPLF